MQWTLLLCEEETKSWQDQQLMALSVQPHPPLATTWATFQAHFEAWWANVHEANKALDHLMSGTILQKTSVKKYNDYLNEVLNLTNETGANIAII
jgi:hypothetical protein